MFEPFYEVVTNVSKTSQKYEAQPDHPVIGVMPAYSPLELIEAARHNYLETVVKSVSTGLEKITGNKITSLLVRMASPMRPRQKLFKRLYQHRQ